MSYTTSTSQQAKRAITLVVKLQKQFAHTLQDLNGQNTPFKAVEWERDKGIHGGGIRFVPADQRTFDRASVNVSHVHYDDIPEKKLASATALSAIVHPNNPHCPSVHMHFSWTEMRDGSGYWRLMADLNPSIPNDSHTVQFNEALKAHSGAHYDKGKASGDDYFFIPALKTHRGISHFYLEGFNSGNFDNDYALTESLALGMIKTYGEILTDTFTRQPEYTKAEKQIQIDYHTLYVYQVLTLDKGTTAGILVHNQNDLGVFGSLPSTINGQLFQSWIQNTPAPLDKFVTELANKIGDHLITTIGDQEKLAFAKIMRQFYAQYPELVKIKSATQGTKKPKVG